MDLKVRITAYKKKLIIETVNGKEDANFFPAGGSRIGCVLSETEKHLGMSKEAVKILKTIKKSGDDIGDISTWKMDNSKDCIAWLGGLKGIIDTTVAEGDNKGIVDIGHVTIENEVPPEALSALE